MTVTTPDLYGEAPGGRLGAAAFSDDAAMRWRLIRVWGGAPYTRMVFIMLNPSAADATHDDPTVRRCIGFAAREGCNSLLVLNLVPVVAVHPARLAKLIPADPGAWEWRDRADTEIITGTARPDDGPAPIVVCGWGAWGGSPLLAPRSAQVRGLLAGAGVTPLALGFTANGQPAHPLYRRAAEPLIPWGPGA
jgi:hypothetical protein